MPDLSGLTAWLQSLGTGGYILAAAIPVILYFLRKKFGPVPVPPTPTPDPSPAVAPLNLGPKFPLLNSLLSILFPAKAKAGALTTDDVPHATLMQLRAEIDELTAAKASKHSAALADLDPVFAASRMPIAAAPPPAK